MFVVLLRGINVGGKNRLPMADFRSALTKAGYSSVKSYIASGNILLDAANTHPVQTRPAEIAERIGALLIEQFSIDTPVLVISGEKLLEIEAAIPSEWQNDAEQKSDVLFLFPEADRPDILEEIAVNPEVDHPSYIPGAVLWNCSREEQGRSRMSKIISTPFYQTCTIRNVNTVRKLAEMLRQPS